MKKLLTGLMAFASFAATAASFSYQGVLKTAEGNEVANKTPAITFRLYETAESELTQALWGRKISVLLDKDGLFNVELSDAAGSAVAGLTNKLDQVLTQYGNSTLYIGLEVENSSGEIRPRQKVLAVPTASFAQDVKTARGDFSIAGNATIGGALTVEKGVTLNGTTTVESLNVSKSLKVDGDSYPTVPSGVIVMWSGSASNIPKGWALCNGENKTPDLRDRFIVGAGGSYAVGATGGANEVTLTIAQMPSHKHTFTMNLADIDEHWKQDPYLFNPTKQYPDLKGTYDTGATGGDQPHENRPPYYALCFIMKM
jgi:microcystin-dependent protein